MVIKRGKAEPGRASLCKVKESTVGHVKSVNSRGSLSALHSSETILGSFMKLHKGSCKIVVGGKTQETGWSGEKILRIAGN